MAGYWAIVLLESETDWMGARPLSMAAMSEQEQKEEGRQPGQGGSVVSCKKKTDPNLTTHFTPSYSYSKSKIQDPESAIWFPVS